jgi:hypothetical protein
MSISGLQTNAYFTPREGSPIENNPLPPQDTLQIPPEKKVPQIEVQMNLETYKRNWQNMTELDKINKAAIASGKQNIGYWIGNSPEGGFDQDGAMPIFVLAEPVEIVTPMDYTFNGVKQDLNKVVREYVFLTPLGVMKACFDTRRVDSNGKLSPFSYGFNNNEDFGIGNPIGEPNFLELLRRHQDSINKVRALTNVREINASGPGPESLFGLGINKNGHFSINLGVPGMDPFDIKEGTGMWSWVDRNVSDEQLAGCLKASLKRAKTVEVAPLNQAEQQSKIIAGIIAGS